MTIKIIKNEKIWMEEEAIRQVEMLSKWDGIENAAGLPDLHSGFVPVGTTFQTKDIIYPFLIGNDIGCGMSLFNTNIKAKKFDLESFCKKLENTSIEGKYSIGGGNHFAEIQIIDKIYNNVDDLKLDKKQLYVMVHSGSRNIGNQVFQQFNSCEGLKKDSDSFNHYLKLHDEAIAFAKENRVEIAKQLMEYIGIKFQLDNIVDCMHNGIEEHDGSYYHHKGSISAFHKYAIIAGTRGDYSYIVKCIPQEETLFSISHGAGRKWPRNLCKGRLENKYKKDELKSTKLGGRIITDKKELLYEEASEAYKNIEDVIEVLTEYNCIEVVAQLKPLLTYKA